MKLSCLIYLFFIGTLLLWSESGSAFDCNNVSDVPESECLALNAISSAMGVDVSAIPNAVRIPWINPNETTVCDTNQLLNDLPVGIYCSEGHVTEIQLFQMDLQGHIPTEIEHLIHLQVLDLGYNFLTGVMPPQLGNLFELTHFSCRACLLDGTLPPQLGNLIALEYLDLYFNILDGTLPTQISNLTNLKFLDLSRNQFIGRIPSQIGKLTQLTHFNLSSNQFDSGLPLSMANLINLEYLDLGANDLGNDWSSQNMFHSIPDWLYDLNQLTYLDLSRNDFHGSLSPAISQMQMLVEMNLSFNQLAGYIPAEIGGLAQLEILNLSNNNLKGVLPDSIGNLSDLNTLRVSQNFLGGVIPTSLNQLGNLEILQLDQNQFSFSIPYLTGTNIPKLPGYFLIDDNCINSQQAPAVMAWLADRNVNLNNQNPVIECQFFFPVEPELISRTGFAQNYNNKELLSAGSAQDIEPDAFSIQVGGLLGNELKLTGNTWKMIPYPYEVTPHTTLQFMFQASGAEAEVNGVALARDVTESGPVYYNEKMLWQVFGTQNVGIPVGDYSLGDGFVNYCIPVGQYLLGGISYLIFINDDDGTIQPNQSASYLIGLLGENQCTPTP